MEELHFKNLPYIRDYITDRKKYMIPEKYKSGVLKVHRTCPVFDLVCRPKDYIFVTKHAPIFNEENLAAMEIGNQKILFPKNLSLATWSFIKKLCNVHSDLYSVINLAQLAINWINNPSTQLYNFQRSQGDTEIPWEIATKAANWVVEFLSPFGEVKIVGSLRRKKERVGDLDFLIVTESYDSEFLIKTIPNVIVKSSGKNRAIGFLYYGNSAVIELNLWTIPKSSTGSAMLKFTGPKGYTIGITTIAKKKGLKLDEYGLFDLKTGEKIAGETELSIYKALGKEFKAPRLRGK